MSRIAFVVFCALIIVAPFEATRPLLQLPGQALSTVEVAVILAVAIGGLLWMSAPAVGAIGGGFTAPWLALVGAGLVASVVAPEGRSNALHMTGRFTLALCVYVLTRTVVTDHARLRRALWMLCTSGVLVAIAAVLEYAEVPTVLSALHAFRPSVALLGAQVRASGPLQYPTIASMYLEICVGCGLGLLAFSISRGQRWRTCVLVVLLAVTIEGIVVTFTRSGLVTVAASLLVVAVICYTRLERTRLLWALAAVALIAACEVVLSRSSEVILARLSTEGQEGWYRARIEAPASLALRTGGTTTVPLRLTNTGRVTWTPESPQPFRVAYHWLEDGSPRVVEWEGERTLLPSPVAPGESVDLAATVRSPSAPGQYQLVWDIEQESRLWFSTETDAILAATPARVDGPAMAPLPRARWFVRPAQAVRPGRLVLWAAAARMYLEHPITGVGPDNYRLLYGRYAGIPQADPRTHSNNSYLELLVGMGAVGALALGWCAWRVIRRGRVAVAGTDPLVGGLLAAVIAIAIHGLVDSFAGFTPTYVLMAITLGLFTFATDTGGGYAHRV